MQFPTILTQVQALAKVYEDLKAIFSRQNKRDR